MKIKLLGCFSLVMSLLWLAPHAHAQQLVKRLKCSDFFAFTAPIEHRYIGDSSSPLRNITVQIVRDGCRPKGEDGRYVLQKTGPGAGRGNHDFRSRYRGYTEALTLPYAPGDAVRVYFLEFGDVFPDAKGTFDYTYTIH